MKKTKPKYYVPQTPRELFENTPSREETILNEGKFFNKIVRIEYHDGIKVFCQKATFPRKGFPFPEAIWSINVVKKYIIELTKIARSFYFLPSAILFVLSPYFIKRKFVEKLVFSITRFCYGIVQPYILKPQFMTPVAREVTFFVRNALLNIGIQETTATECAKCVSFIIEYDNAYRYRFQDVMSSTTKMMIIKKPIRELIRLHKLYLSREKTNAVARNEKMVFALIMLTLLSRKFKKALIHALGTSTFSNFQFDDADAYWAMDYYDYEYMGMDKEQREGLFSIMGYTKPRVFKVKEKIK